MVYFMTFAHFECKNVMPRGIFNTLVLIFLVKKNLNDKFKVYMMVTHGI
jgi:RNAse (barnase) inhibitor barstar